MQASIHLAMLSLLAWCVPQAIGDAADRLHLHPQTNTTHDTTELVRHGPTAIRGLIYNRVPKCGSSTLIVLLTTLGKKKKQLSGSRLPRFRLALYEPGVAVYRGEHGHKVIPPTKLEWRPYASAMLAEAFALDARGCHGLGNSSRLPTVFVQHVFYAGLGAHWRADRPEICGPNDLVPRPLYINMVREPVARWVSHKLYLWYGPRAVRLMRADQEFSRAVHNVSLPPSIDKLVTAVTECEFGETARQVRVAPYINVLVAFFCGLDDVATCAHTHSDRAAELALQHLEAYAVVGVLEAMRESLFLLERAAPQLLKGLVAVYDRALEKHKWRRRRGHASHQERQLSNSTHAFLAGCLRGDRRVYDAVRARMASQLRAHGAPVPAFLLVKQQKRLMSESSAERVFAVAHSS